MRLLLAFLFVPAAVAAEPPRKFIFTADVAPPAGVTRVAAGDAYTKERGYGYDLGTEPGKPPFAFSLAVPEGNYRVTAAFGADGDTTATWVKAESRRLMAESVVAAAGKVETRTFVVNVRTPKIAGGGAVKLKDRETGDLRWDDKLTLEFLGPRPALRTLEIADAPDAVTVFLVGDSTVTDQAGEPWGSWGQMLPRFFGETVAVANYAESGETLKSSFGARRLEKALGAMKPGDYLFIQFGHNDMKEKGEGVGAFTTYAASLKQYVEAARTKGGRPVLVTPMHRNRLDAAGKIANSLGDYPEAVRKVAAAEKVPLIDLHAMSGTLYEALGPKDVGKAFQDGTHHNNYGSYELARCVVEGIRANVPDLAKRLAADAKPFDPAKPDPPAEFKFPASSRASKAKPEGS